MARGQRKLSDFTRRTRRGSMPLAVGAAVAAFGLVLGAMFLVVDSDSPIEPENRTKQAVVEQLVRTPETSSSHIPSVPVESNLDDQPVLTESDNSELAFAEPNQSEAAPTKTETPADRVRAHAEAGEFGLAMDVARNIADIRERAVLLRVVADAQMEAGEFAGAMHAIQRIPVPQLRGDARGELATQEALAGGGSLADFQPLIDLIQQETSGPWVDLDGTGGTISSYDTGVRVDPNGQLAMLTQKDYEGRLEDLGIQARQADLNKDMAQPSSLRVVSLTRLEAEIARRMENGQPVLTTMKHLAGLSSVKYVFVDPKTKEIMIAGPAEGWKYNDAGIPVGIDNGKPTLQLDDFVTVMRIFSSSGNQFFNCLIVPRKEGLQKLSEYVERSNKRGSLRPGAATRNFAKKCQLELGLQDAVFNGVPLDSRVARVILEADYRMKLIGIDKLDAPNIPSYFDLLTPQAIKLNPPRLDGLRWWMTMKYDAVLHSPSRTVFEIQGPSVQCLSENELIEKDGSRIHTGKANPTNQMFAQNFTQHYGELAERDLVFSDLKNIFDLSLVAALMHRERLVASTDRGYGVFTSGGEYETAKYEPPKTVMSVVNHKVYNGRDIIVQVAGGVRADLVSVLKDDKIYRESTRLDNMQQQAPKLPEGRWWWDVK